MRQAKSWLVTERTNYWGNDLMTVAAQLRNLGAVGFGIVMVEDSARFVRF